MTLNAVCVWRDFHLWSPPAPSLPLTWSPGVCCSLEHGAGACLEAPAGGCCPDPHIWLPELRLKNKCSSASSGFLVVHLGKQQLFLVWSFPRQSLRQGLQTAICNTSCFCFLDRNLIGLMMSNNRKIDT